ncbi:MAG: sulfotransferase domain-containing protein [Bacteroidales bacterium]|nr:sulfotransferase domain-containing protein [Bacteroidales bacterium]
MKPIIIIAGVPQSYTSMVSKLLIQNGGFSDDTMGDPNEVLDYERFESEKIDAFVQNRKKFKKDDLTEFFQSLPEDRVIILKLPFIIQFINELKAFTHREIKVIYVFRNPQNIILSSMNKWGRSFIYYFERMVWFYDFMVDSQYPVFPLVAERLLKKDEDLVKRLFEFCDLKPETVNYDGIDESRIKSRPPTYLKYRFANFVWKRLSELFRVYK